MIGKGHKVVVQRIFTQHNGHDSSEEDGHFHQIHPQLVDQIKKWIALGVNQMSSFFKLMSGQELKEKLIIIPENTLLPQKTYIIYVLVCFEGNALITMTVRVQKNY